MRRLLLCLFILIASHFAHAAKMGDKYTANDEITLYSVQGYDNATYEAALKSKKFESFRNEGVADLIPRRITSLPKDTTIEFIRAVKTPVKGKDEEFFYVRYVSPVFGVVYGYAPAKQFRVGSIARPRTPKPPAPPPPQGSDPTPRPSPVGPREPVLTAREKSLCSSWCLDVVCQSNLIKNLDKDLENFGRTFKSQDELTKYMYDYRKTCNADLHTKYVQEYRHYVKLAAESFQVPEALLTCLLFKENQWGKTVSSSNARGIAQILPSTSEFIQSVIRNGRLSPNRVQHFKSVKAEYENYVTVRVESPDTPITTKIKRRDYTHARNKLNYLDLRKSWVAYADRLTGNSVFRSKYVLPPWEGRYPEVFTSDQAEIPPLAIGASALYLRNIIDVFEKYYKEDVVEGDDQLIHFLTAMSGAYNAGEGNAVDWIGTPPPKTAEEWVKKIGNRKLETKMHMESIRRCMKKGDERSPQYQDDGRIKEQNKCPPS